ncbi:efflux RND transporter periplasmic adaptor subunit [Marinicella sediminis]|uniref:Efflux RND transporter periplasmic adaptor subunit n=1 Tax=Marinicella sediminis TaxID=1792834 RepID=A0ABV7J9G4_9GAMM|nr:efflux RND transporter periplasmic adaptor subunit [Marinicella sediminis]
MKIRTLFIAGMFIVLLTGCDHQASEQQDNAEQITYGSAEFSPNEQYKVHQVAAFVVPTDQASLSFQVSGVITRQWINIGDSVEPEQPLFSISNPSLEPQIAQFESQIEAIEATLEQNRAEVKRVKNLKKTNAVSQNELDRLTNQQDNLQATKKSLQAQLEQAQSMYDETVLKAPFAGNVAEIYKENGEVISPGEPIMVLGGITSLEAPIYLPSFLHRNISPGQQLPVRYENHVLTATVKEISQTANPQSQLFKVMIEVPIAHQIKSGEKVTVQLKEHIGQYYRLPIESVIDDGINDPFVLLIVNNQVIQTHITLIDIENNEVIVELPHQGTIEVVTSGQVNLSPNQRINQS